MNNKQLSPDLSDLMTELAFLLVSRSTDEHSERAWEFMEKLAASDFTAAKALAEVSMEWVRTTAQARGRADILATMSELRDQLAKRQYGVTSSVQ